VLGTGWALAVCSSGGIPDLVFVGGRGGIRDSGPSVKEERGNLRQRDICEGEEGEI